MFVLFLFIYLFIIECCTEGKFCTQSAKNLSHWVTTFRHWVSFMSPFVVLKMLCLADSKDIEGGKLSGPKSTFAAVVKET